jgi:3-deoxy-D-manno-octulosonic-acid transferase
MRRLVYSALLLVVMPIIVLRLLWRGTRQPGYLQNVGERFGLGAPMLPHGSLWLHAVSVGEMRAAEPLVKRLLAALPEQTIYLTCMTPTGRETAHELFGKLAGVRVAYLPYDFTILHCRVMDRIRPSVLIVMETEIWPNLLAACASRHIPAWLANARLSPRSLIGYQRFDPVRNLIADALSSLHGTAAQTPGDAERLRLLGATNIVVTGNVKFDVLPDPAMVALGLTWRQNLAPKRGVLLAASTRDGEEILLLKAFRQQFAQQGGNGVLLVLVPRHPQRFNEVAKLVEQAGLRLQRRSIGETISGQTAVWLGDSMGEMAAYVAMCDLAFVGGSLLPLGGQNLIEVCAQGKPVLMGPSVFNFAEAARLAGEAGALQQAGDGDGVMKLAALLLGDEARRTAMSLAARKFADTHAGASDRLFALVTHHLPDRR